MHLLYVYDGDWPKGATRVAKEARSLVRAGHTVRLLSRNSLYQPRQEDDDGLAVLRLPNVRPAWLNRWINFPFFFNPVWVAAIWRAAREMRADRVLVADLPLAPTALLVGGWLGIPVLYDMAEVYPEFLRSLWQFESMAWTDYFVRNPALAAWLEIIVLRRVQRIFVVTEESRDRCLRLGVPPEHLVIVGNTPEHIEELRGPHPLPADLAPYRGRPLLLFVGILIGDRGVVDAVEAMAEVIRVIPAAVLVVVGDGKEVPRIRATIDRLALHNHVVLTGWKQHELLPAYYTNCHVGLLPFRDGNHVRLTLANKLFDYMAAGLPVIAADLAPMRRVLDETAAGLTFPPGDVGSLARRIVELLGDEGRRAELGANGLRAVERKYRWEEDERRLLAAVGAA